MKKQNTKIVEMSFYLIFAEIWETVQDDLLLLPEDKKTTLPDFLWKADKGVTTKEELKCLIGRNTDNRISLREFVEIQEEITGYKVKGDFEKDINYDWKKYADTLIDIIFEYVYGIGDYTEDELNPSALYSIVDYKYRNINTPRLLSKIKLLEE